MAQRKQRKWVMTNSLVECPNSLVLPFEAKEWIENTFERALFNLVWKDDEPVSIIVTVHNGEKFFLSKGKNLVDIQQELESWRKNGITNSEDE